MPRVHLILILPDSKPYTVEVRDHDGTMIPARHCSCEIEEDEFLALTHLQLATRYIEPMAFTLQNDRREKRRKDALPLLPVERIEP